MRNAMSTNITTAHREVFQALRDGSYTNFALLVLRERRASRRHRHH
jgi:hypothetical protein